MPAATILTNLLSKLMSLRESDFSKRYPELMRTCYANIRESIVLPTYGKYPVAFGLGIQATFASQLIAHGYFDSL